MLLHMKNLLATRYNSISSNSSSTHTLFLPIFGLDGPVTLTDGLFCSYLMIYDNAIIIIVI